MRVNQAERRLIDGLLEAAVDGAPWPHALAGLAESSRATVASMILVDRSHGCGSGYCIGVDEPWASAFVSRESRHVAIGAHFVRPGQVFTDRMAVPRGLFERSTFFETWARPSGQTEYAGISVINEAEEFGFVGLSRGSKSGAFGDGELERFERLAPHIRRAAQIWTKIGSARVQPVALDSAFDRVVHGVLLTDANAHIKYANQSANELLALQDGLTARADGLAGLNGAQTAAIRAAIAASAGTSAIENSGRPIRVRRRERAPLTVLVAPLRSSLSKPATGADVLVVIVDPDRPLALRSRQLQRMYGLSPAESLLACHLIKGVGLKTAARALDIAPTTARTYLKRIFGKTNVRNQIQLAELAAGELLLRP